MEQSVITVSLTGQVVVWDSSSGTVRHSFTTVSGSTGVSACGLDPDALLLPTPNKAKGSNLEIWSLRRGKLLSKSILRDRIITVQTSPDGLYAVGGSTTGQLYCWDLSTGRLLLVWKAHYHAVTALCFAGDEFIISGAKDNIIRVWELGDVVKLLRIRDDGTYSGIGVSESAPTPVCEWNDHALPVTHLSSAGGATGRVVSASSDGTARVWDVPNRSLVHTFDLHTPLHAALIDPTGTWLYAAGQDAQIHRVLMVSRSKRSAPEDGYPGLVGHNSAVISLDLSADGSRLVSGSMDGSSRIWDTRSGQTIRILRPSGSVDEAGKQRVSSGCYALFTAAIARQPPPSLATPLGSSQQVDPLSFVVRKDYPKLAPTMQSLRSGPQSWVGPLWLENVELHPEEPKSALAAEFLDSRTLRDSRHEDLLNSLSDEAVFEQLLDRGQSSQHAQEVSERKSEETSPPDEQDRLKDELAELQKKYDRLKSYCVGQILQEGPEDEIESEDRGSTKKQRKR